MPPTTLQLDGRTVQIDLDPELPTTEAMETFVIDLETHARAAKAFIEQELTNKKDATVRDFLAFHLEELPPTLLAPLLDPKSKLSKEQQLLAKLVPERVGLDPKAKGDGFAIFDFTFEGNTMVKGRRAITDQLIAVYVDAKGVVGHLSHES